MEEGYIPQKSCDTCLYNQTKVILPVCENCKVLLRAIDKLKEG